MDFTWQCKECCILHYNVHGMSDQICWDYGFLAISMVLGIIARTPGHWEIAHFPMRWVLWAENPWGYHFISQHSAESHMAFHVRRHTDPISVEWFYAWYSETCLERPCKNGYIVSIHSQGDHAVIYSLYEEVSNESWFGQPYEIRQTVFHFFTMRMLIDLVEFIVPWGWYQSYQKPIRIWDRLS